MGTIIALILLLFQIRLLFRKDKIIKSISYYFICAFLSPNFVIGGMAISYEIIGFLILLINILLYKKREMTFSIEKYDFLIIGMVLIDIVASIISAIYYSLSMPWVSFVALFRYLILFLYLKRLVIPSRTGELKRILDITLITNFVFSIIQVTFPTSVGLFQNLYGKESNAVLSGFASLGYYNRAVGTLGSPALVGPFALFCLAFYLMLFLMKSKYNKVDIGLKIFFSIGIGVVALSKTFIIGTPIIIILCLLFSSRKINPYRILRIVIIVGAIVFVSRFAIQFLVENTRISNSLLDYYFNFVKNPIDALNTRYSSTGNVLPAISVFKEHPIFGVGVGSISGEFVGDSAFVNILHNTGVVGALLITSYMVSLIARFFKEKNYIAFSVFIAILLAGIGIPSITELSSIAMMGYLVKTDIENTHQH